MKCRNYFLNIALPLLYLLSFFSINAQEVGIKLNFFGFADNREFRAPYTVPKTILGTQLSPQVYLKVQENHYLYGGLNYKQFFGSHDENKSQLNPIAYYNYKTERIDFALGFIPRHERLNDIPRVVLADTFMYNRPNMEGLFFQYKNQNFKQSIYIDWLSEQGQNYREQFIAGIAGHYQWNSFYFKNYGLLYHNALSKNNTAQENIQDNAVLMAQLGLDLSNRYILDSLKIDAGVVVGFDRIRNEYEMRIKKGFITTQHIGFKRFGITNSFYLGQAMNLPNGDPFYHRSNYDRLDLSWTPFKSAAIEGKFIASFHFTKGQIDNQQAITLRYSFGQPLWKKSLK